MTNGGQRPDPLGFRIENEMDLLLGRAHPNPTREGCPPRELLVSLSRRELPIGDPAYDHFSKCSPCYQELRALQQADAATRTRRRSDDGMMHTPPRRSWCWRLRAPGSRSGELTTSDRLAPPTTQTAPQSARLDLRPLAVTRSRGAEESQLHLSWCRAAA